MSGGAVAAVRVGVLWLLIHHEWTHQQSLAILPLVLLLFPEGFLLPAPVEWTTKLGLLFSTALIAGSFVWVLTAALVVRCCGTRS